MSAQIEEFWHRLKAAAQECAKQERCLNERSAQELVFKLAAEIRMSEKMPAEVVAFYVGEVLALVREFSSNEARQAS